MERETASPYHLESPQYYKHADGALLSVLVKSELNLSHIFEG